MCHLSWDYGLSYLRLVHCVFSTAAADKQACTLRVAGWAKIKDNNLISTLDYSVATCRYRVSYALEYWPTVWKVIARDAVSTLGDSYINHAALDQDRVQ